MSLQPHAVGPIPEETVRVARAAFPKGNPYMAVREVLGSIYEDGQFAALFPAVGQHAAAPWRLALVTALQYAGGLSDEQAANAVRSRIDWKHVLGLPLEDAGFDASVLCEFRARLLAWGAEAALLETLLRRCREHGVLKERGKQRTDSTHVLAAIRVLHRLECVGETMRHALDALAVVGPDWLRSWVPAVWYDRYARPFADYHLPAAREARYALAEEIGADGFQLLQLAYAAETPGWVRAVPAVQVLRRVWLQQFYAPAERVRWRSAEDLPPPALLISTPYDPEARYSKKRDTSWTGYKVHLTETCDLDAPRLLTNVETTPATTPDFETTEQIQGHLASRDLLPSAHYLDAGYLSVEQIVASRTAYGVDLVGPVPDETSWQAQAGEGFATACFALDWDARRATCPQGQQRVSLGAAAVWYAAGWKREEGWMRCQGCQSERFTKEGHDRQGRQVYRWMACGRRCTEQSASAFAGYRFLPDIIALAVRWYLRYRLSYADMAELLAERGVHADRSTIYDWVQHFAPLYQEAARAYRHAPRGAWSIDETYIKVAGTRATSSGPSMSWAR